MTTTYRLALPYERPPTGLSANTRAHWRTKNRDTQTLRATIATLAQQARIQPARHLTVELVWAPGDRRKRDADNLWPMLKAACDGLARGKRRDWVGLDLVPDDTPEFMTKKAPRIVGPDECREQGMWLLIDVDVPAVA